MTYDGCILKGHIKSNKERQLFEQIVKYNCHINGLNKDESFLRKYRTFSYT